MDIGGKTYVTGFYKNLWTNGIPYRHPLYALLKDFKNEKRELLRELGLTPYARKRLTGTNPTALLKTCGQVAASRNRSLKPNAPQKPKTNL